MVPNKTIYIREADTEVWERAEKLAGGSVSALITEALRRYISAEEQKEQTDMENIEVDLQRTKWDTPYTVQFVGRWLLHPDPSDTRTSEDGYDAGAYFGVALTQRGKIAVYVQHVNDGFAPRLTPYSSFEEAERSGVPGDILATAAADMGADYVQKWDI